MSSTSFDKPVPGMQEASAPPNPLAMVEHQFEVMFATDELSEGTTILKNDPVEQSG